MINNIFKKKYSNNLTIKDGQLLEEIKVQNRKVLSSIPEWLSKEALENSYFDYGVPDFIRHLLGEDIGTESTYTDAINYYARHFTEVNYLELGVSVGKNFLQVASHLQNSKMTAFDIENINKPLAEVFTQVSSNSWASPETSIRKEPSTYTRYSYKSNEINYLAGDIWDENSWKKLEGQKYNIIFSDALHDPKALIFEYEMIKKYNLLAKDFMIIWDDLNHGLEVSFFNIVKILRKEHNIPFGNVYFGKLNGWLGKNEIKHDIGLISSIHLD